MKMERVLLTDFSNERWNNRVNIESVKNCLETQQQFIPGELFNQAPGTSQILLKNVSHIIANVQLIDNCIYGDVEFMDNPLGKLAQVALKRGGFFGVRGEGDEGNEGTNFKKIATWDVWWKNGTDHIVIQLK